MVQRNVKQRRSFEDIFLCMDCKKDTFQHQEYFMLKYKIWRSANYKIRGMLCLACIEKRIGRDLVANDFSKAPINESQSLVCQELSTRLMRR